MKTPKKILQSPHWVDAISKSALQWHKKEKIDRVHVDDMKTPSGRVHTGALRGVMIHDVLAKVIAESHKNVINTYVFNDMDPMDGLPSYLDAEEYSTHMGKPMYKIPAPSLEKSGINFLSVTDLEKERYQNAQSFGEFYAFDFIDAFRKLGCSQEIIWSHQLYESGKMDDVIREVLDKVDLIKKVYKEVADYELPPNWFPFQVICPKCGKVGTTLTTSWDGSEVSFECLKNRVKWAEGCGFVGKVSPFGGTGKLLWKVDWPAHWKVMGVTLEGSGKDHTSAGGSRDMANAILKQVINSVVPFDAPYEWILIRGAKMSSSKGVGTSAREFVELFPTEVGRFLFIQRNYGQVIDFDPTTQAIPDLFDQYDEAAQIFWGLKEGDQRLARSFELSQVGDVPQAHFLPRFRDVAMWMQLPSLDLVKQFEDRKGEKLTKFELEALSQRQKYAQIWLERYAPSDYNLLPVESVPQEAFELSDQQKSFLQEINQLIKEKTNWDPQELQQAIFDKAKAGVGARQGFQSIYTAYLGKTHGPRAAWLLLSMDEKFREDRAKEIVEEVKERIEEFIFPDLNRPVLFSVDSSVSNNFPSVIVGIAVIKGVKIEKINQDLNREIQAFTSTLDGLTAKELGDFSEIQSYRRLYKETGVDWHSRRSSPEALLRRVVQKKGAASVNTCVDAYNLVVMKHRVSAGAFNLDTLEFPTKLKLAKGGEKTSFIGDKEPTTIKEGEICYFDQVGAYNLDFNYRDSIRTAVDENTNNLLINVEGVFDITRHQVEKSLNEVIEKVTKYCGGLVEFAGIIEASKETQ